MIDDPVKSLTEPAHHAVLIERVARDGDRAAFAQLFAYFAPRLKGFLIRGGSSPDSADDLSQEAMLMVWRKAAQFDASRAGAATWIYTIARNLRIDAARRGVLETVEDEPEQFALQTDGESGEAVASNLQREGRVREAVALLPEDQAKVVMLAFFYGKAHADVARELALPLGTVKSRLRLAANKLRSLLGELSE